MKSPRLLSLVAALSLCGLIGDPGQRASAQATRTQDRAAGSGLGVGLGLGTENVGLGGHVVYYVQLPAPRWRVALHAGAGIFPDFLADVSYWGMTGGAFLGFGKRHRLVVGLIGGTIGWATFALHEQQLAARQILGVGLSAGWELMTRRGFFVRGNLGPALAVQREVPLQARETSASFVLSTSIGYKLW